MGRSMSQQHLALQAAGFEEQIQVGMATRWLPWRMPKAKLEVSSIVAALWKEAILQLHKEWRHRRK
jgi:hypothetical protein